MAQRQTISRLLHDVFAAYPGHVSRLAPEIVRGMPDTWQKHLADIDDELLTVAVTRHIEHSQWLPSIAEIRASAVAIVRHASPARQTASEAWYDVKRAIASVGHYFNRPQFDNPATAAVVKRMGWREICLDDGPEGVLRAQFERYYNAEIDRLTEQATTSPAVAGFIDAMSTHSLPERDAARQVIGDVAKRLEAPRG